MPSPNVFVRMPMKAVALPVLSLYSGDRLIGSVPYDMSHKGQEYRNERLAALRDKCKVFLASEPADVWYCIENVMSKVNMVRWEELETLTA